MSRRLTAAAAGLLIAASVAIVPQIPAAAASLPGAPAVSAPLTNLAHLDFLTTTVTPPPQAGHTTYQLGTELSVGVLWVYANYLAPGSYQVTGGGTYDAANNTYGQGAYDADDISRAAVVYLQHWVQFGDSRSRDEAYQLLRGLTYLQTASGPNAGNVVLWMQPDGSLNPTPTPADSPNPSDSGASYWLARTIWALGEGYADFRGTDPAFAAFLRQRLDLAIGALDREVLTSYGQYQLSNGLRVPAWLITGDADASSEAVLGLAAYVQAGGGAAARTALAQLADGIADMGSGTASTWPYGAILPSVTSRSEWHPWAAQMPTALAAAATALQEPGLPQWRLLSAAVADTAVFTPHLLTATGPDNLWGPAPVDSSQIAYGAGARVLALLAVAAATHSAGLRQLAGVAAGWFFGQNPAGLATGHRRHRRRDQRERHGEPQLRCRVHHLRAAHHGGARRQSRRRRHRPRQRQRAVPGRPANHRGRGGSPHRARRSRAGQPGQYRRIAVERRRLRPARHGQHAVLDHPSRRPAPPRAGHRQPRSRTRRGQRLRVGPP
jgi:hypothetical protein